MIVAHLYSKMSDVGSQKIALQKSSALTGIQLKWHKFMKKYHYHFMDISSSVFLTSGKNTKKFLYFVISIENTENTSISTF